MGNTHHGTVATLKKIPAYVTQSKTVFPRSGVTIDNLGKVIAPLEQTVVTFLGKSEVDGLFCCMERVRGTDLLFRDIDT